jgi:hypothetical protein
MPSFSTLSQDMLVAGFFRCDRANERIVSTASAVVNLSIGAALALKYLEAEGITLQVKESR